MGILDREIKGGKGCVTVFAVLCLLGLLTSLNKDTNRRGTAGPARSAPRTSRTPEKQESVAYKLAVLNADGWVAEDHITVTRFGYLLREIQRKTKGSPTEENVADACVTARDILRNEFGKDVGLLELMEAANKSIPAEAAGALSVRELFAALVTLVGPG